MSRGFAAAVAILCFALGIGAGADSKSKRRLEKVEKRIHETEREKQTIETETAGVLGEIDTLDKSVDAHARRLKEIASEVGAADNRRLDAERRLHSLDRALARLQERFSARAGGLYRLTRRGLAPVVLQAPRELADALRYRRGLEAVLAADRALVAEIRRNRAGAEAARVDAASATATLSERRAENERELAALRSERSAKQVVLASLRGEGEKRTRLLEELRSSAEELRTLLQREDAAAKAAPFRPPPEARREMLPPLAAAAKQVTAVRNGVEIRASTGTSIQAVSAGRVVFADWFTGYGKMVILDHGNHLYSIYGYAAELLVVAGRVVKAGEPIATVGATGPAIAPSLYFELRDGGAPRDPSAYMSMLVRK